MLKMNIACPYCFGTFEAGHNHMYQCPALHERINTFGKRGRLTQPLDPLTHDALVKGCNCLRCNEEFD